jgi:hypothetical protein
MRRLPFALAAIFLFLLGMRAQAVAPSALQLPVVGAQVAAGTSLVKLVDQDCGFVSAVNVGGRFFVGYQTRPDGHVHIAEDTGEKLVPVTDPTLVRALSPAFELPGPKQGSLSLVGDGTYIRAYYTGRDASDPSGPFFVWRLRFPEPA